MIEIIEDNQYYIYKMKLGYIRDLLFISIAGYFSQGVFYAKGSTISQLFLIIIIAISSYYFIRMFLMEHKKSLFYNAWTALLVVNIIGFIFTGTISSKEDQGMFKGILLSSLPFYPLYYFARRGALQSKHLIRFLIIILPITMSQYFFNANRILMERDSGNEDVVNNLAYSFVWLLPFAFLFKKRKLLSIGFAAFLMFFIILGAKRGALITGAIGLLVFIYYQMRTVSRRNRKRGYAILLIGVVTLGYYTYDFYQKNEFLVARMDNLDGGSGRVIIFKSILNNWSSNDHIRHLVFGNGFLASKDLSATGNRAHNDWLELLSNFGLIGLVIYGILFYAAIKIILEKNWGIDKKSLMLTVILMWFFVTMFSMGYTNGANGYLRAIILGLLIGNREKILQ